ncbi:MAG: hypothetical protein NTY19_30360 [Planctomycetota bacterium]|nr:hypothetical protein [Planctomycetota bacterium]
MVFGQELSRKQVALLHRLSGVVEIAGVDCFHYNGWVHASDGDSDEPRELTFVDIDTFEARVSNGMPRTSTSILDVPIWYNARAAAASVPPPGQTP